MAVQPHGRLVAAAFITLCLPFDEIHGGEPDAALAPEHATRETSAGSPEDQMDLDYWVFLPVIPVQPPASAFPAGPGFYTGIAIQNLGSAPADILVIFQDAFSDQLYTYSYFVNAGGNQIVTPHNLQGFPLGFMGSAEIASSQPVQVVVNLPNKLSGSVGISGGAAQAQYRGVTSDQTDASLRFPLVKHRFHDKSTALALQNAGHADTTLIATFRCADGGIYARAEYVEPRKMVVIRPEDVPGLPSGNTYGKCAATVSSLDSSVPFTGVSLEYQVVAGTGSPVSPAVLLQAANGFTPADHASKIHFPIVKRLWGGRTTGHQVQNVSTTEKTVRITYTASSTCTITGRSYQEAILASGASATFHDFSNLSTPCLTTATVETIPASSGSLVGIANEECSGTCSMAATTYDAIADHQLTSKLVAPLYKEDHFGKRSGMLLFNPSSTASAVTVTFTTTTGSVHTCTTSTIGAGQFLVLIDLSASSACTWGAGGALPNGTVSSLSAVTVNASARLAGVLNEDALDGSTDAASYEAVNVPR